MLNDMSKIFDTGRNTTILPHLSWWVSFVEKTLSLHNNRNELPLRALPAPRFLAEASPPSLVSDEFHALRFKHCRLPNSISAYSKRRSFSVRQYSEFVNIIPLVHHQTWKNWTCEVIVYQNHTPLRAPKRQWAEIWL